MTIYDPPIHAEARRQLQAGQHHDPGYDVPELRIGQRISGHTVVAAIREHDGPGLLPGLHLVTAHDPGRDSSPYVTWEVAWQRYTEAEREAMASLLTQDEISATPAGRWVANAGHYKSDLASALRDMAARAGVAVVRPDPAHLTASQVLAQRMAEQLWRIATSDSYDISWCRSPVCRHADLAFRAAVRMAYGVSDLVARRVRDLLAEHGPDSSLQGTTGRGVESYVQYARRRGYRC